MALVKGTNCGFVTTAPTEDPGGTPDWVIDTWAFALKDVSAFGAQRITEIGWWCDNATEEANFEVGLYSHNVGDNNPEVRRHVDNSNAKGTTSGWKTVSVDWAITGNTIYWIAVQLDNTSTATNIDAEDDAGEKLDYKQTVTSLPSPWGVSNDTEGTLPAIYALVEGAEIKINIGDVWKEVTEIKINIGDVWKEISGIKLKIQDAAVGGWQTIT